MLVDIFSTFDDYNQVFMFYYILLWTFSLIIVLLFSSTLWVTNASGIVVMNVSKDTISSHVLSSFCFYLGFFKNLITALFLFLILINLSGLIPYVFSSTSHLAVLFSLGFPLWLALILSGCFLQYKIYYCFVSSNMGHLLCLILF